MFIKLLIVLVMEELTMDYHSSALQVVEDEFCNLPEEKAEEQVHDCLKRQVFTYLDQHPNLSLRSISLRAGVSFTTLSRLTKSNLSNFAPHIVLNLSAFLWREYRLEVLVDTVPSVISRYLLDNFGKFISLRH